MLGALALRVAVLALARRQPLRTASGPSWHRRPAIWLAGVGVAAYQPAFFLAVRTTGVAVGTVVALGSAPVLTGALAWACGGGRPGRRWAAATTLAIAGLGVLASAGGAGQVRVGGLVLALAAGAAYAVYTVTVKGLLDDGWDSSVVMAAAFAAGAAWLAPLLLVVPFGWLVTPAGAATAIWLAAVPTALAYLLFARGLRDLAAAEVSTLTLAEPVTAAALGIVVLGEPLTGPTVFGATLIFSGLAALALGRHHRRKDGLLEEVGCS
jgi:DME family drug/metabolite transporter